MKRTEKSNISGNWASDRVCYCDSGKLYAACCQPYHQGCAATPNTPEALMRSRYSAFAMQMTDYLRASWSVRTRPAPGWLPDPTANWLGLKVVAVSVSDDGTSGTVEFVARCRIGGRGQRHHELSRFERHGDAWYYVDGTVY